MVTGLCSRGREIWALPAKAVMIWLGEWNEAVAWLRFGMAVDWDA